MQTQHNGHAQHTDGIEGHPGTAVNLPHVHNSGIIGHIKHMLHIHKVGVVKKIDPRPRDGTN